jgi:Ca-activated chloride channel family protein
MFSSSIEVPSRRTQRWRYDREMLLRRALVTTATAAMAVLAAFPVVAVRAEQSQVFRDQRRLESGVDLVMVTATVLDAEGHLVTGLPREAFGLWEDGVEQTISVFSNDRVPVGLGVLLDVSDSMFGQRIIDARAAVEHFLFALLNPADEFFLTAFNHAPRTLTPWTSTPAVVSDALNALRPSGGTAIYDAVVAALPQIDRRNRQRAALLIISDGADTASDATLRDVRAALLRSDAFVYAIAIDSPNGYPINTRVNPAALSEITGQSGGRTEVVHDAEGLVAATGRIAEELNSQYVLGYSSPKSTDGKFHSIRVSLRDAGMRVRARNGYVGSPVVKPR